MESTLKYSVIRNRKQYDNYCSILETLVFSKKKTRAVQDEIDLLTVLIEKYDSEHNPIQAMSPAELLRSFIEAPGAINQTALAEQLEVSKGYVSDMVNGKKAISREMAIKLAHIFRVSPLAFFTSYHELLSSMAAEPKATYRRKRKSPAGRK